MAEPSRYEKDEKDEKDEKEVEKHEEKTMEEKWRRDPLGTLIWALILIWAGVVWLGWNLGIVTRYAFLNRIIDNAKNIQPPFISLILLGAGILILIEIAIRLLVPTYRRSVVGSLIIAAILIGLGLGETISWSIIWPLIIIVIGLVLILQGLLEKDKSQSAEIKSGELIPGISQGSPPLFTSNAAEIRRFDRQDDIPNSIARQDRGGSDQASQLTRSHFVQHFNSRSGGCFKKEDIIIGDPRPFFVHLLPEHTLRRPVDLPDPWVTIHGFEGWFQTGIDSGNGAEGHDLGFPQILRILTMALF